MRSRRLLDECLEAALDYAAGLRKDEGLLPRSFYYRLRLNGHMAWPVFRSTSLPTFPNHAPGMEPKDPNNNTTTNTK